MGEIVEFPSNGSTALGYLALPGADHAFFNDTRPEVHDPDASAQCRRETLDFFRENLG